MKTLVVASKNKGKIKEIEAILGGIYDVVSMESVGIDLDIEETGATFEENALIKAKAVFKATGLPSLADDSGIVVDALGGRPGIFSARFAANDVAADKAEHRNPDQANNKKLLNEMRGIIDRKAKFVSAVALVNDDGSYLVGWGETSGEVLDKEVGANGFGYDPLFYSYDLQKSFGEASAEEKNQISHRRRALTDLLYKLGV